MIAQVRPLRPEYAAASLRHLWGVVLPRSNPPLTTADGHYSGAPKVRRLSSAVAPSRLQRPLEGATHLIPTTRLVTVLTREAAVAARDELAALPGVHRCVQPSSRGTAPEVFLA